MGDQSRPAISQGQEQAEQVVIEEEPLLPQRQRHRRLLRVVPVMPMLPGMPGMPGIPVAHVAPLIPVNGIVLPQRNGLGYQSQNQVQFIGFDDALSVDELAELMHRRHGPPMNLDDIQQLLDVIEIADQEEDAANEEAANEVAAAEQAANDEVANEEAANDEANNEQAANEEAANEDAVNEEERRINLGIQESGEHSSDSDEDPDSEDLHAVIFLGMMN